jgi:tetratricopeptide (TPR) repeat protein
VLRTLGPVLLAGLCVMMAASLLVSQRQAASLRDAETLGERGEYARAIQAALEVTRAPAKGRALYLAASGFARLNRPREADRLFESAAARDPNNWTVHHDWAILLAGIGQRGEARRQMERALALNPRARLPITFSGRSPRG